MQKLLVFVLAFFCHKVVVCQSADTDNNTVSVHHYYNTARGQDSSQFSALHDNDRSNAVKLQGNYKIKTDINVFGFHPGWLGDVYKYYNFTLLTHIAYAGYDVNPVDGGSINLHGWDTTGLITLARKENPSCKILLTSTCFGSSTGILLRDTTVQRRLINNLKTSILQKKADGVCIDFEGIPGEYRNAYTNFIKNLRAVFKKENLLVTITLPAVDFNQVFDIKSLNNSTDLMVMMGYDYFGGFSTTAGPVAPLKTQNNWIDLSIVKSVSAYQTKGIDKKKLIVAFPYYGAIWETDSKNIPGTVQKFVGHRPYSYVADKLDKYTLDTVVQSYYLSFSIEGKPSTFRQVWIDGSTTLGKKYDYVLEQNLGGIGMWALGFDYGSTDLWELIKNKCTGTSDSTKAATDTTKAGNKISTIDQLMTFAKEHKTATVITGFMLMVTLLAVLLALLLNAEMTTVLKNKGIYYQLLVCAIVLLAGILFVLLFFAFRLNVRNAAFVLAGLIAACVLLKYWLIHKRRSQP